MEVVLGAVGGILFFYGILILFGTTSVFGVYLRRTKWSVLNYDMYTDTSFGKRIPSCRFTVINERTQEIYNRICYGKPFTQGEIAHACRIGVAHKLGEED